jgi:hypothetical protein
MINDYLSTFDSPISWSPLNIWLPHLMIISQHMTYPSHDNLSTFDSTVSWLSFNIWLAHLMITSQYFLTHPSHDHLSTFDSPISWPSLNIWITVKGPYLLVPSLDPKSLVPLPKKDTISCRVYREAIFLLSEKNLQRNFIQMSEVSILRNFDCTKFRCQYRNFYFCCLLSTEWNFPRNFILITSKFLCLNRNFDFIGISLLISMSLSKLYIIFHENKSQLLQYGSSVAYWNFVSRWSRNSYIFMQNYLVIYVIS